MKYLKIDNYQAFYCTKKDNWIPIDKISKEDLLILLDNAIENDFEMDEFDSENLKNPAHQIIYKNIYNKFQDLLENKNRFKDECKMLFKDALEKYSNNN